MGRYCRSRQSWVASRCGRIAVSFKDTPVGSPRQCADLVGQWREELLASISTSGLTECHLWVCAVKRRRFPVGASPTRQPLEPEATGAVMEVTKWLKPSDWRGPTEEAL